jgi:hypothetical protein
LILVLFEVGNKRQHFPKKWLLGLLPPVYLPPFLGSWSPWGGVSTSFLSKAAIPNALAQVVEKGWEKWLW